MSAQAYDPATVRHMGYGQVWAMAGLNTALIMWLATAGIGGARCLVGSESATLYTGYPALISSRSAGNEAVMMKNSGWLHISGFIEALSNVLCLCRLYWLWHTYSHFAQNLYIIM